MSDIRYNQKTGEAIELVNGAWKPVDKSRMSVNKSTGEVAIFDGNQWNVAGRVGPAKSPAQMGKPFGEGTVFERPNALAQGGEGDYLRENKSDPLTRTVGAFGNYVDAAMFGGADEALAGIHSIFGGDYNLELARLAQARRDYNALNTPEGTAATVAGIVGNPTNAAGGEFISAGKTGLSQAGRGALLGGSYGGAGGYLGTDGDADQRLQGAALGGLIGGVGGGVLPVLGSWAAPRVSPDVALLRSKGINMTPGQIAGGMVGKIEERLSSLPIAGDMMAAGRRRSFEDLNRAVIDDVLAPIGKKGTGEIGRKAVAEVEQTIGKEYDRVLNNITFYEDAKLGQEITALRNRVADGFPETEAKIFEGEIKDIAGKLHTGYLTGEEFKTIDSHLGSQIARYKKDPSAYVNQLGDALEDLQTALRDSLPRTNPMHAQPLQNANAAWAKFKRLQRAVSYVGTRDTEPGVFNPDQFQSAVKALDRSKDKGAFARGQANMQELSDAAKNVLGNKVPDSGTPQRLAAMLAGAGGLGYIEPTTMALTGAMTLPYLPGLRNVVQSAMTHQGPVSDAIRQWALRLAGMSGGAGAVSGPTASPQLPAR